MELKRNLLVISTLLSLLLTTSCGIKGTNSKDINSDDQSCGITAELRKILNEYNEVIQISNGLILVSSKSTKTDETGQNYYPMGCVDMEGNVVIPIQYEGIALGDKVFCVSKRTNQGVRYGLLDMEGNEIVPMEYEEIFGPDIISHKYVKIKKDGKYGLIDKKGNVLIPIQYDEVNRFYVNMAYNSYKEEELPDIYMAWRNGKPEVINLSPEKMKQKPFTPYDVILVGEYGNQSFLDYHGNVIAGPYQNVRVSGNNSVLFSEGLAAVVENNRIGFIDMQGVVKIPFKFDYTEARFNFYSSHFAIFSEGWAAMMKGGKWGYIDKTGNLALPFVYDWADCFHQGVALVGKEDRLGIIDKSNKVILPFEFENGVYSGNVFTMCKNGKWGVYSPAGECLTPCQYDVLISFFKGYATVKMNGKSGLINERGNLLIPCQYDACLYDQETNLVYVQQNGKQGYVDLQNQVVVPIEFDLVGFMYGSNLFKVRKDGREGLYDLCGNCTLD